ncbi:MAG: hypothetical protein LQ340_000810 [Diploschistes diacapsis]|nr:MAG: hypothetical protein LQ340_000810 [Diploschistes diacapsis]
MRGRTFFDDMETRPAVFEALHDVMNMAAAQKTPWPEICPPESVISRMKPQVPLLVDVGGGTGVDIEQFRQRLPADAQYELILQDLPSVLEGRKVENGIVPMGHDFFTDQPVKGATAYYLHTVLHSWPDDFAVKILEQLAKAVEPGYSSLLIHEVVVDETPSDWDPMVDLYMLSQHISRERKEKAWADLLDRAGFVIVKVWRKSGSIESVIEAQRPAE